MIDLFIALFGGAYYGGKLLKESNKKTNGKYAEINKKIENVYFERITSDKDLEESIQIKIGDPDQYEEIWGRVSEVLHSLEHWESFNRTEFDLSRAYAKSIAIDILMADRGKIPIARLRLGYDGRFNKEQVRSGKYQEYVEWIGRRVKEMGSDAHLVKQRTFGPNYEYAWQYSLHYNPDKVIEVIT